MEESYTTKELAACLGISRQGVDWRARRESWSSRPRAGRGGGREWLVSSMPESTRLALAASLAGQAIPVSAGDAPALATCSPSVSPLTLRGAAMDRAQARSAVVLAYRSFTVNSGMTPSKAAEAFAVRYNAGEIAIGDEIRTILPRLCRNSVLNWEKRVKAEGSTALAGRYGVHRRGKGHIDSQPRVRELVLGMFKEFPHTSARVIWERIQAAAHEGEDIVVPSLRRVQAWLRDWKLANPELVQYVTAPDQWRSRFMASCGSAYEKIVRYNQRWEYDGTPADLMLNDGHRYTIVGIINVYSRELILEVAERSTGLVVGEATRRALIEWGVPEEIVTDNGKEFVGKYMQGLFVDLRITATALPPFRPDLKPAIERVFRTFSHHLLTLCPCYVGHNVATRQQIRERRTFAARLMDHREPQQLSMAVSPEQLQEFCDDWCRKVYAHRDHRGLGGRTPYQMRQEYDQARIRRLEDIRCLDVLLLEDGDWRTVTKKGVNFRGETYDSDALRGNVALHGMRVRVRYSRRDADHIWVFNEAGEFVCEAVRVGSLAAEERSGLAGRARRAQRRALAERDRELREAARAADAEHAVDHIMNMHRDRAEVVEAAAPVPQPPREGYVTPAAEQAARAVDMLEGMPPQQHEAKVAAARERTRREMRQAAGEESWIPEGSRERGRLCQEILDALARGEDVPTGRKEWAEIYRMSNAFQGYRYMEEMKRSAAG